MEEQTMARLCDILNKKIESDQIISEEQINIYLQQIFEYICHSDSKELPHSFYLLRQTLFKKWEYGTISHLSSTSVFILGALWGGALLSELADKERTKQPKLEILAKQNMKYLKIFDAINKQPGIKHKDLADISGMTTSELSQWMAKRQNENYFSFSRIGREKYYYIEKKGEEILQEMERQSEDLCIKNLYTDMLKTKCFVPAHKHSKYMLGMENSDNINRLKKNEWISTITNETDLETLTSQYLEEETDKWNMKKQLLNLIEMKY